MNEGEAAKTASAGGTRAFVFKNRGALLALPAVILVIWGRPSAAGVAAGLPLALLGEAVRCWAVGYSGVTTRNDAVTAPRLVTAGPYAHVRNPLYLGNFLTAVGFAIAFTGDNPLPARLGLIALSLAAMLAVYATIVPHEEAYLRKTFGAAFDAYAVRVPRTLPRLRPATPAYGSYDAGVIARAESRTFLTFGAMLAALALKVVLRAP